ncbi:hypothetical protein [Lichenicoccus sp.]|uniref:hypothetical protein n=1 Tax=Lichenicoccus sp. TaxID=2781899 RepID=UPI003D0D1449
MSTAPFYEAGRLSQIAINLFHGWGYNFYRLENQLRADDLLVRAKVCETLGAARHSVEAAEAAWRQEFLPAPSRTQPRPEAKALRGAQTLEAIGRELGVLEGQIRSLPAPESDRMTERFRTEAVTLRRLAEADEVMAGHAEFLRALLVTATATWMIEAAVDIHASIMAVRNALQDRSALLAGLSARAG